jgi:hypothetical protein
VKQKRFNVEQIVAVLKQVEAGVPLVELIPGGNLRTDLLLMEEAVCGAGGRSGSSALTATRGERSLEAVGRRYDGRQNVIKEEFLFR